MTRARFDPSEVEAERKVIGEERAREMESPQARLDQTHQMVSYLRHPYRNPVLGWPEDVAADRRGGPAGLLPRALPARRRGAGAGRRRRPGRALDRIEALFGAIRGSGRPRRRPTWDEPPQAGRRDFTLVEAESLPRGLLGWHTVPRGHRDCPALDVLADVLTCGAAVAALADPGRAGQAGDLGRGPARAGAAGRAVLHPGRGRSRVRAGRLERRIAEILGELAAHGPTAEELAGPRTGWKRAGGGSRKTSPAWLRGSATPRSGATGATGRPSMPPPWPWTPPISARWPRVPDEGNLTVGWSLPRPASAEDRPAPGPAGHGRGGPRRGERSAANRTDRERSVRHGPSRPPRRHRRGAALDRHPPRRSPGPRLPAAALEAGQWPARHPRTAGRDRRRRPGSVRRRRLAPRGAAGRLPA